MQILAVGTNLYNKGFGCALTSKEERDFEKTQKQAKESLGISDGMSVFKIFQYALPADEKENTGIGKLNSNKALEYLKFMKLYTGANIIKEFPSGTPTKHQKHYYCPYLRMATVFGEDNINLNKLTTLSYGKLLSDSDIAPLRIENKAGYGFDNFVNYENELGTTDDFPIMIPLRKAYNNMHKKPVQAYFIRHEFDQFKTSIDNDFYNRLALATILPEEKADLFKGLDYSEEKQREYKKLVDENQEEIDFFKFRKFLATKQHEEARRKLHKEGLELFGDCPIGFSIQEVRAFPDAFYPKHITPGWGFRSINFEEALKEGTPANKLFSNKIRHHIKHYDGVRFDVGWLYIKPNLKDFSDPNNPQKYKLDVGDKILKFIENIAYEEKGLDYDTKKLMYESDAGADDYQLFDYSSGKPVVNPNLIGRTSILHTLYESDEGDGWGNPQFLDKFGLKDYIIGTNNHDGTPVRAVAEDDVDINGVHRISLPQLRENAKKALKKSLNLSEEDVKKMDNPNNFVKAKFGELYTTKNRFFFFNDVMGNKVRLDYEGSVDPVNYRIRLTDDYEKKYHSSLQKNQGFNLMESLRIAMKSKRLDESNPELYSKVKNYADYLSKEGPKTRAEAEIEHRKGTGGFDKYVRSLSD